MNVEEAKRLEKLEERMNKLEKRGFEDTVTLLELLSSITFFGALKKENCTHAKDGQCGFFVLGDDVKKRIPIATECRIKDCKSEPAHYHLELSNVTCAFCHMTNDSARTR